MENTYDPSHSEDVLADFEVELQPANGNLRFINFLIDRVVFYLFSQGFYYVWGNFVFIYLYNEEYWVRYTISLLVGLCLYGLFMGLTEALFKGKTVGKLVTGTRAVNGDGSFISFKTAMLRGFSRSVPFEPFSALAGKPPHPWHDRWTKTYVIVEKKSRARE